MAFNIVDLVARQFTPDLLRSIAGLLGEDQDKVGSAVSGASPALMGGLLSNMDKPASRRAFEQAINDTDDSILDDLIGAFSGNSHSMMDQGGKMLGGILGGDALATLGRALSGFSGISGRSSSSLLGLLAPLLFGSLKRKGRNDGLDISGLINMLRGQKANISSALPADLGGALRGSGLLNGLEEAGDRAASAASSAASAAGSAARQASEKAVETAEAGGSMLRRVLPILLILVAVFLLFQMFNRPSQPPVTSAPVSAGGEVTTTLAAEMETLVGDTIATLQTIDSPQTAQQALGNLQSVERSLDSMLDMAGGLPEAQSVALASTTSQLLPRIQAAAQTARQVPGVESVVGSQLDAIEQKFTRLMQR